MTLTAPTPEAITATRLEQLVGNTPLVRLRSVARTVPAGVEIWAKCEFANPGGSVKDRPALAMIEEGERSGRLTRDRVILDATSGNTGIAYAMIAGSRGYRVQLCLPANASPERQRILRAYGADLILTDPEEGSDGAIREARRLFAENPSRYFYPDQYNNPANWRAHYESTAPEIWAQTAGRLTHFVAALGTSGTFVGTARRLKEFDPSIVCASVQPDSPFNGLEGMKHMATAIVPGIYDPRVADLDLTCDTESAQRMARRLARREGLLVGISAGANVATAVRLARELEGERAVIVTVLCDTGARYLSERFWEERDDEDGDPDA